MAEEFKMEDFILTEGELTPVLEDEIEEEITKEQEEVDTEEIVESEEEITEAPTQESDKEIDKTSSSKTNIYSSLSKGLSEEGVFKFVKDLDKIDNFEDFATKLDDEIEARLQERVKELTPDQQFFVQKKELGYSNDEIIQQLQTKKGIESITPELLEANTDDGDALRKQLISEWYKSKGFSEAKIERDLRKIFNDGSDIDEAKEAINELKTSIEIKSKEEDALRSTQLEQSRIDRQKALENLKQFATNTKEIIPGSIISKKTRDEIFNGMTKPVSTTEDGMPLDIVGDFLHKGTVEDRYKLSYILKLTDGLKDLSKLSTKQVKSKIIAELESALNQSDIKDFQQSALDENFFRSLEGAVPVNE